MTSVIEAAKVYEPKSSKTVADLPQFDVTQDMFDETRANDDGTKSTYKVIVVNGEKYRVPYTVLADIKEIYKIKSDLKYVKVTKSGSGKTGTKYTTIPM